MSDLISRSALIMHLNDYALQEMPFKEEESPEAYNAIRDCITAVEDAPAVEAKPVVHGEWIKKESYNDGVINTVACSVCGTYQPLGSWDYYEYCSYCGAKMRKKVE